MMSKGFLGKNTGDNNRYGSRNTITVAVLGASRGVGSTSFSVMLAGYLANVEGRSVAIVGLNEHGALRGCGTAYGYGALHGSDAVLRNGALHGSGGLRDIRIYEYHEGLDVAGIVAEGYDYVIMDMSLDLPSMAGEFARSHIRFVICGLVPWKLNETIQVISRTACLGAKFLSLPECAACAEKIYDELGVSISRIPYVADVQRIEPQTVRWLRSLMEVV